MRRPISRIGLYPKDNRYNCVFIRAENDTDGTEAKM